MKQGIDSKVRRARTRINKPVTKSFAATVIPGSNLDNFVIHFRSCYDLPFTASFAIGGLPLGHPKV
jgi:hypothetical protein